MKTAMQWCAGLRDFVVDYRTTHPLAITDSTEESEKARILKKHSESWLSRMAPSIPPSHVVAFTTSDLGVQIMNATTATISPPDCVSRWNVVPLRELEYRLWTKIQPDASFELHVNHWNWIKAPVPKQRWKEFVQWPIGENDQYWLHRTGTQGPGTVATRHAHLYHWNGTKAALLQKDVSEQVKQL